MTCAGPPLRAVYSDGAVLIEGGRIRRVGPRSACPAPEGALHLDLGSATLLPGIIDAHVHEAASLALRRRLLLKGVTSVGDVGSSPDDLSALARTRGEDDEPVARAFATGPMFGPPGGYPGRVWPERLGLAVCGASDARRQAVRLLENGASMLKIAFEPGPNPASPWPVLDLAAARAVVNAAHERGAVVRCHVQELGGLALALRAGVDTVEHTVLHSRGELPFRGERGSLEPGSEYALWLRRLAAADVLLVPTLEMGVRAAWDGSGAISAVRAFCSFGGRVALGTDAPMRGVRHGMPLGEMALLGRAGLSPAEVLRAATRHAALALGRAGELGELAPGQRADLVAVADDPVADLSALGCVSLVVADGAVVHHDTSSLRTP